MSGSVLIFSPRSAGHDVQNNPGAKLRRTNRRCIQASYYKAETKSLDRLQGRAPTNYLELHSITFFTENAPDVGKFI